MYFSLDVRRARKGDCLLLHFGPENDPGLVVIDGGPSNVYGLHLKPRLSQIAKARRVEPAPLPVDLLMVSHVDDDHIAGILDLTKELRTAADERRPQFVQVLSLWHNSFDEVIGRDPAELVQNVKSRDGAAAVDGQLSADTPLDDDLFAERPRDEVIVDTLKVLASIEQGHRLRTDAERLQFPRTPELDGKLALATAGQGPVEISRGLAFTVVGPLRPELADLQRKHDEWLADLKAKGKKPPAALAAYVDESVPNLSSIVVMAEAGGKRMLLTGDARGDKILEGLELVGLVAPGGRIHVEVLKVPHHGSANNLETGFFERITADHYVFSGNGQHGNPERESLEMLRAARGDDADFAIHLTYPIGEIEEERKKDWDTAQATERKRKAKNPKVSVRPDWSPADNGLAAFFDAHPRFATKVRIVGADERHLIDLLDRVPF